MNRRTPIGQRIAAFVAMLALALNLAALPLAHAQAAALDSFGQPICTDHANGASNEQPGAPDASATCQFCCTVSVAASVLAPILPLPLAVDWTSPAPLATALQLPSPSRHLIGPPRGPPLG